MKIKTRYCKKEVEWIGDIEVKIEILDREEYPFRSIFDSWDDYPTNNGWELKEGKKDHVSKSFLTGQEAKNWAHAQVQQIKKALNNWRDKYIPLDEDFTI